MTDAMFDPLALDPLAAAVVDAFGESGRRSFLRLCDAVVMTSVNVVVQQPFAEMARDALIYVNRDGKVPRLLPELLKANPGHAVLRAAAGKLDPAALEAISDARFAVEQAIDAHLSGADAKALRDSLSRSDDLLVAINAYKTMHDALHTVQPLLPLIRQLAASASLWPQLRLHLTIFGQTLQTLDAAIEKLRKSGRSGRLPWRNAIQDELDELGKALDRADCGATFDSASLIAGAVSEGLNSVDLQMLDLAEEAARPLETSLEILTAIRTPLAATKFEALAASYIEFAARMSAQLKEAIDEHTCWQDLDSQFQELQRVVIENESNASINVDSLWRIVARKLERLCGGPPPHSWAESLAERLEQLRSDLNPPITPPLADSARDRISELIAQGRRRFMELDRNLLDWLEQSVERRPELSTLLKGGEERDV